MISPYLRRRLRSLDEATAEHASAPVAVATPDGPRPEVKSASAAAATGPTRGGEGAGDTAPPER